jgi:F-type H+-transporting ATPase subunit delta
LSAVSAYAEALFGAAREREELEETLENLQDFVNALHENSELKLFFYGEQIPESQKRRAIDGLTEGMTVSTRNFLKVLLDYGRAEITEDVVRRYEELVEEHQGKVEVELTTAVELSDEVLERVKQRLGNILEGREVVLENHVDRDLVGGAVFTLEGKRIDGSLRGQLQGLREQMMERGGV